MPLQASKYTLGAVLSTKYQVSFSSPSLATRVITS